MWPKSAKRICVTMIAPLLIAGWAQEIHAQQQVIDPTQQNNNALAVIDPQTGNVYGGNLPPAQQLAPMLSPQDAERQMARQMEEQQRALQAQRQAQQNSGQMQQQLPPNIQLVPQGQQAQAMQQVLQQTGVAPQQPLAVAQTQAQPANPIPPQQTAPTTAAQVVTPGAETAPENTTIGSTASSTETTEAAKVETPAAQATTTSGFSPQNSKTVLPLNSGMMPATMPTVTSQQITNPGMDMNINPNMVGGVGGEALPYEVQLKQRTQEIQQEARGIAFDQAKKSVLPMESYEIRDVLGRLKDTQEAIQTPVRPAPKPDNVIRTISTDPSATPKVIRLAAGNVTTVNIVDVTGEPWPIVDIGFGGAFDVKPPEAGGHVIRVTPLKDFARGNLVVRLLKLTTPLTFSLQAGGNTVNYRFDARIPEYGPNAKMPLIGEGINAVAGDKTTTSFLEGVPPKGAEKLVVGGIDGRTSAYKFGGALYVRTPLSLISPAWQGSATSADGMNVYVLGEAPVLLLSDKGSLVRARINEAKTSKTGF